MTTKTMKPTNKTSKSKSSATKPKSELQITETPADVRLKTRQWSDHYRPTSLNDIIGNPDVVTEINGMMLSKTVPHTIGIFGPSGCGKTTLARILAITLCNVKPRDIRNGRISHWDLDEVNVGDKRSIEDMRNLTRVAACHPMISDRYRVIIFDEFQAVTGQALSSILKVIEEPHEKCVFIICTDQPDKLSKPALRRCHQLKLTTPKPDQLIPMLVRICKAEKLAVDNDILHDIAQQAEGQPSTAISLLQKLHYMLAANPDFNQKSVESVRSFYFNIVSLSPLAAQQTLVGIYNSSPDKIAKAIVRLANDDIRLYLAKLLYLNRYLMNMNMGVSPHSCGEYDAIMKKLQTKPSLRKIARVHETLVTLKRECDVMTKPDGHLSLALLTKLAVPITSKT